MVIKNFDRAVEPVWFPEANKSFEEHIEPSSISFFFFVFCIERFFFLFNGKTKSPNVKSVDMKQKLLLQS